MTADLVSLAFIALIAFVCPLITQAIPGKPIPETVLLLIAGTILGPHVLGVIYESDALTLLSDLGLAFLFLLAGYDINPQNLTGHQGRRGLATWCVTFVIAFCAVILWPSFSILSPDGVAVAIALTTTALGTLLPIMQERKLMETRVGDAILAYGTWGELCPIIAMALLLSTRAGWITIVILVLFSLIAIIFAIIPKYARKAGSHLFRFIAANADTNSQMLVRSVLVLLIGLTALSAVFNLDIVLGAFAAGFALRYVIPEGSTALEGKLNSIAYGFLIPLFFILSGTNIDIHAVANQPTLLIIFILLLLMVRAVPILVSLSLDKQSRTMALINRFTVAIYCTTALPLIVAVTTVAVDIGAMSVDTASVLVAAGGITVLIMPLIGQVTYHSMEAELGHAVREIMKNPRETGQILKDHRELERMINKLEENITLDADTVDDRHRRIAQRALRAHRMRAKDLSQTARAMGFKNVNMNIDDDTTAH